MAYRQRQTSHGSNYYQDATLRLNKSSKDSVTTEESGDNDSTKWSNGFEFSFACLGFSLNLHSLWLFPLSVIQHGGLTFVLMYLCMVAVCGVPVILMEMGLGQYSGMAPGQLFYHLCPLVSGLGVCQSMYGLLTIMQTVAVMTWISHGMFLLFRDQNIVENLLYEKVLNKGDHDINDLGSLNYDLVLVLGIVTISLFILVSAGLKSVGKVNMVTVPACFMIIIALTIRSCFATGATNSIMKLLQPNWSNLTSPTVWLEAACQAFFSLHLGSGVISTYASYNRFYHNIVRDCCVVMAAHVVWVTCCLLLCFSLFGVAGSHLQSGTGLWLVTITLVESGLAELSNGWLWAGLFFILLVLVSLSTVLGYLHLLTTTIQSVNLCMVRCQPLVFLVLLCVVFCLEVLLMTQGGVHIYHLLYTFILQWPLLLFTLLTILATIICHGVPFLVTDIADMSKIVFHHWLASHLAVGYYTILPIINTASLGYFLYTLHIQTLEDPLHHVSMTLPDEWGVIAGWCLAIFPLLPLFIGALVSSIRKIRGRAPFKVSHLFQPSDSWYSNEHISSSSPVLEYQTSRTSTEYDSRHNKQRFHSEC